MARIGMGEGVPIEHRMVSRAIERAQRQVEGQNFTTRKHLLEYDDVMNKQRETIYKMRKEILEGKDMKSFVQELIETLIEWHLDSYANKDKPPEDWDVEALKQAVGTQFGFNLDDLRLDWAAVTHDELRERILGALKSAYEEKERLLTPGRMREFERIIMLQVIDSQWKDHLQGMDYLKEGIGLRGYGQRDPLIEYKKESYDMFQAMMDRIEEDSVRYLFLIQPVVQEEVPQRKQQPLYYQQPQAAAPAPRGRQVRSTIPRGRKKH
jgi:preprotein translocase subunit SecA